MKRGAPLSRGVGPKRTTTLKTGRGFAASKEQRSKVEGDWCVVCGQMSGCDPAHLTARAVGGCDDALCVVALCRQHHRAFDQDRSLDLLPYLIDRCYVAEVQHALGHYNGNLVGLLQRLTNERWQPVGVGFVPEEATQ
jgi:hypothetical protein